jgi:thioredoxin reductase (NADPH)
MASPPSALDAATQAFPSLTEAQIDRVRLCGRIRHVERGEILFEPADTDIPFFVVLTGAMEIVQPIPTGGERMVVTHGPAHFTGELTMISGQRCLVVGRVTEPGEFLELSGEALRMLVARDAELSEIFMRAFILRRLALVNMGFGNIVLLGSRHSAQTLNLREFLSRNGHPYTYVDLDTDQDAQALLDRFDVKPAEIPVVICTKGALRSPSIQELARCLGFNTNIDRTHVRDLIIAGGGPAGLAAAVYAASEGLNVLVIETSAPGGQAGSSSKIENYLGFPTGVSGLELAARATTQAQKFGANMMIARSVLRLNCDVRPYQVILDCGEKLDARAIVIATGAQYNKLRLENLSAFEGKGVYYGATFIESQLCGGSEVAVVGGGNSAGQAAVFLSQTARKVHMVVRSSELSGTMSRYLIQRLMENPQIELHWNTEITALEGGDCLERVTMLNKKTGQSETREVGHVFVMTGASPRTDWLRGCLALDDKGFILTGRDLETITIPAELPQWPLKRGPLMLETSLPGVFAVGDVRANNVKRVASAVGEGAISISLVHRALAEF